MFPPFTNQNPPAAPDTPRRKLNSVFALATAMKTHRPSLRRMALKSTTSLRRTTPWFAVLLAAAAAWAMDDADIPADAPQDEVMASPAEVRQMLDWASVVFAGAPPPSPDPIVRVEVLRQDHNVLRFGQSCMETPLRIGTREFQHGLGTHANSEIVLHLPPNAKTFKAYAGSVLAFRRADCPYPILQTGLRGLRPDTRYAVEFVDEDWEAQQRTFASHELSSDFELRLPKRQTSLLVRYRAE